MPLKSTDREDSRKFLGYSTDPVDIAIVSNALTAVGARGEPVIKTVQEFLKRLAIINTEIDKVSLELGSDEGLARLRDEGRRYAGLLATNLGIEIATDFFGVQPSTPPAERVITGVRQQNSSYTAQLEDRGTLILMFLSDAGTFTIPPHSEAAFSIADKLEFAQDGAGQVTIAGGTDVSINSADGRLKTRVQHSPVTLIQTAINEWLAIGDLTV